MKELARLEVVHDRTATARCDEGFLRLRRLRLVNHYSDGTRSRDYPCDVVTRPHADAVAVVLWHREGSGRVLVHLRVATRAAIWLRRQKRQELVQPDAREFDTIVECVAGVLEGVDTGPAGIHRRAAAESLEEAGFPVRPDDVRVLGAGFFTTPGVTDEKIFLAQVEVDPASAGAIEGDGSVMEEGSSTIVLELGEAIEACRRGEIPDAKTEIGLLRLADAIGWVPQLGLFRHELPPNLRDRHRALGL